MLLVLVKAFIILFKNFILVLFAKMSIPVTLLQSVGMEEPRVLSGKILASLKFRTLGIHLICLPLYLAPSMW